MREMGNDNNNNNNNKKQKVTSPGHTIVAKISNDVGMLQLFVQVNFNLNRLFCGGMKKALERGNFFNQLKGVNY